MPKTYFYKYKQITAARFNIINLATLVTYDKLYVERGYHTLKGVLMGILHELPMTRIIRLEFQERRKNVKWCNVKKQDRFMEEEQSINEQQFDVIITFCYQVLSYICCQ